MVWGWWGVGWLLEALWLCVSIMPSNLQLGWVMVDNNDNAAQKEIERKFQEIFFPKSKNFQESNEHGFVYYTNADTAVKIIRNQEIWMRKASMMNDFAEIQHGFDIMKEYFESDDGWNFFEQTDQIFPRLFKQVWQALYANRWQSVEFTYLLCVSKHFKREDDLGRLSMWRAYGGNAGVALVLNKNVFHQERGGIFGIVATEAIYDNGKELKEIFNIIAQNLTKNAVTLMQLDNKSFAELAKTIFLYYAIALKHPAFEEEQEVRVFWHPGVCKAIPPEYQSVETISGIPQKIIKIPLRKEAFPGYGLNNLLSRVLIGPTAHSMSVTESLLSVMVEAKIDEPVNKITRTFIPLRPNR
jgi:hypothetical protein